MSPKKLTRKEITQQDVIRKTLTETSHWAVRNFRFILIAVGVVVLVILAVIGFRSYSGSQEAERQAALAEALEVFHAPVQDPGSDSASEAENTPTKGPTFSTREEKYSRALELFRQLADRTGGTRVGLLARYYAALSLRELGQMEEAEQELNELLKETKHPELANLFRQSLAELLAAQGDWERAAALWQEILDHPSPHYPASFALLRLAQAKEKSGDPAGALDLYRQVVREHPGTSAASEASAMIPRLEPRVAARAGEPLPPATDSGPLQGN